MSPAEVPIGAQRPVLARLQAALVALRRRHLIAAVARAACAALCLQLLITTAAAALSAFQPYEPLWLKVELAAYAVWLWPLFRFAQARRRPAYRLEALAAQADRLNQPAPDLFRTVLSRRSHAPETLDALEALFGAWEPRVRLPVPVRFTRGAKGSLAFAGILAIAIPFAVAGRDSLPGGAGAVFHRMVLPLGALRALPAPRLTPLGIPEQIVTGDTLTLDARVEHVPPGRPVYVHVIRRAGETRYVMARATQVRQDLARFRLAVTEDLTLRFSTAGFTTGTYRVRAAIPPRLASLGVVVTPPKYTGLPPERLAEMPALISVLPGTTVEWAARSALPLRSLVAKFGNASQGIVLPMRESGETFAFRHLVKTAGELRLNLVDRAGVTGREGPFRVELKIDVPPEITMLGPSGDMDLGRTLRQPVLFRASDDHGISRVRLRYTVHRDAEPESEASTASATDITGWLDAREGGGEGLWDASSLRLDPGDAVELWLEASDNDAVSGPKTARTPSVRLRLPSLREVRTVVEAGERDATVSLTSALEREKRLRREAENPDKGASTEAPMPAAEWEVRRVLSDQPRQHLQELRRQLEAEIRAVDKQAANTPADAKAVKAVKALRELQKEAEAQEKRLPLPEIAQAPVAEQKKRLEALRTDQKALDQKLKQVPPNKNESDKSASEKALAENRRALEEQLQRNQNEQKDLKTYLDEKERNQASVRKRDQQAHAGEEQRQQDMKRALDQIDKAMEKGLENGTLSPEILEKMDRIRELLEETLDSDEKERMRREASDAPPEAGDLEKAMQNLMEKRDGLKQNLERAIKMLENLRELRALRDLAGDLRELGDAQQQLAAEMEKGDLADLSKQQEALNQRADAALKEQDRLSKNPAFKSIDKQNAREAKAKMEDAAGKLKPKSKEKPDRQAARKGAELAAKQLHKAAEEMEKMRAGLDKGSEAAEIRAALEETLEFSRWLATVRDLSSPAARAWGGEEGVRQGAVRIARWLRARLQKIADARPFDTDVLRGEIAALGFQADALATAPSAAARESLRRHALGASRELLKILANLDNESGGDEDGDGQGDSENGGGESGDSGNEGVAGRLKGLSGKQSAVNQATQELLRSFLQGRQGKPQGQGGGRGGSSSEGTPQRSGSQGQQTQGDGSPGGGDGSSSGEEGQGRPRNGGTPGSQGSQGAANAQQSVGEALEQLAESADDAGGAARKLRQLAEEARELEAALRGRTLSPDEIRRRQERFQTRLLEAATALEERGRERERRAEAYTGGALRPGPEASGRDAADAALLKELRRRRDEALKLPLPPGQKRRVEWYYDQLLAP